MKTLNLQQVLKMAIPFAFTTNERPNIQGVKIEYDGKILRAIATDGHTLILVESAYENVNNLPKGEYTIELPKAKLLEKMLKLSPDHQVELGSQDETLTSFPDYNVIIPSETPSQNIAPYMLPINPILLEKVSKISKMLYDKFSGDGAVKMTYYADDRPLMFTVNEEDTNYSVKMLLMPMRKQN